MANMTIAIPEGLHGRMRELSEIRWSEVARKAFEEKVDEIELVERIAKRSKLTEKDVEELAGLIDSKMYKEIMKKCG